MSGMAPELKRDPDLEWLDHVQPVGLVVAPIVLKELGLAPSRQTQADTAIVAEQIDGDTTKPALHEPWPPIREGARLGDATRWRQPGRAGVA